MAVFNPNAAPGQDMMPNWTNVTRPISDLQADKSQGLALSNLAGGIEAGAGLAEQGAKKIIGDEVRQTVENTRKDWTSTLEQTRNAVLKNNTSTNNIMPDGGEGGGEPTPPAPVDAGLDKLGGIQAAYSNGKINDTYYHQRLMTDVTSLRAKYPGWVDYIDQKVSSITGVNPANAYIGDLMQDISRAQVNKKTAIDKAVEENMKSGYPGSREWNTKLMQDGEKAIPAWRDWYATNTELDSGLKRQEALRQNYKGKVADYKETRESDWTNEVGAVVGNNMNTLVKVSGVDSAQTASALLKDAAENPGKYTEVQMKEFATKLLAQKAVVFTQLDQRAAQTNKDAMGRTYSYNSDVGSTKVQEIKNQIGQYYDQIYKALWDGGPSGAGVAFARAQQAAGLLADTKSKLYNGDSGEDLRTFQVLNESMGPNWTAAITDKALQARVDDALRPMFTTRRNKASAQPELTPGGSQVPYTFKDMSGEALDLEKNKKITSAMRARYLNESLKIADDITDPSAPDQAKINALKFFFSPEGQGILPNFKDDTVDGRGRTLPGRQSVFNQLTSEGVVSEVARLSKKDPSIGDMYKKSIETEAGSYLYYKELQDLNYMTGHDDLHFKFYDGAKGGRPYVELIDKDGKPVSVPPDRGTITYGMKPAAQVPEYLRYAQGSVNRINEALGAMQRVEKAFGENAGDNLLKFMIHAQVDLGKNWTGLPARMMDAIAASAGRGKLKDVMEGATK